MSTFTRNHSLMFKLVFIASCVTISGPTLADSGRRRICVDHLHNLDATRISAGLLPGQAVPKIIAAQASAHARGVRSVVAVDGEQLVSSGNDGAIVLWSASGKRQREWRLDHEPAVLAVAPSQIHLAVGLANGTVYIMKLDEKQ